MPVRMAVGGPLKNKLKIEYKRELKRKRTSVIGSTEMSDFLWKYIEISLKLYNQRKGILSKRTLEFQKQINKNRCVIELLRIWC